MEKRYTGVPLHVEQLLVGSKQLSLVAKLAVRGVIVSAETGCSSLGS